MSMLNNRVQILVSAEQRRRLDAEAARQRTSVAAVIRRAIDAHLGAVAREDRLDALEAIRRMRGRPLPPEELERLTEEERLRALPR